ncbi:hypothetical protein L6164_016387 [Bauhinia variegata]|uniref:Uncharacterized protein n=1 Tax=Bauhinia variegata TaxID=167791 RepID=A0ACB9NNR3_BAUVA|nr:hypothetical protein L6164_016387 [Bauhinia variegata]
MGALLLLETLDLSSNNLAGPIQQSVENPQYLTGLNLSFNHLEGQVPMKGAFMNFREVALQETTSAAWIRKLHTVKKEGKQGEETSLSSAPLKGLPPNISYADIRTATNNFAVENLVGKGGFGNVYKGMFNFSTALRNVRHRNLVKVISCCSSVDHNGDEFKALVMQFMCYGNLDMWLHPEDEESVSFLSLQQRLNTAVDVASPMYYLHHDF